MAKKKIQKNNDVDEVKPIETVENEVVNVEESIVNIEPIDMSEELEVMKQEIFGEDVKKEVKTEEVAEEPIVTNVVEEQKEVENKVIEPKKEGIVNTINKMFGYIWNGMEYD